MATQRVNVEITAQDRTAAAFNGVKERLTGLQSALRTMQGTIAGGIITADIFAKLMEGLHETASAVYDNTVTWQGMEYTLKAAGLSSADTAQQLKFLTGMAQELGVRIQDTSGAFSRFVLTAKTAGESLPQADAQFRAISAAMRIFHLSNNQVTRSWLAMSEIMAMGTVKSRQFTQQLGRDWPGIGALIAQQMYPGADSMKKFMEAMKGGKISATAFMQAFVDLLHSPAMSGALSGAEGSIQAATSRLSNAWFNLTNEANNTKALDAATKSIDGLAKAVNDPDTKKNFDTMVSGLAELGTWAVKAIGPITKLTEAINDLFGTAAYKQLYHMFASGKPVQHGATGGWGPNGATASFANTQTKPEPSSQPTSVIAPLQVIDTSAVKADVAIMQLKESTHQLSLEMQKIPTDKLNKMSDTHSMQQYQKSMQFYSDMGKQAAANVQNAFASLFTNFHDGVRGMVHNFAVAMQQMIAQMLAFKMIQSTGAGSWFGSIFANMGPSGGGKASGGPVYGGESYLVGESGPELLTMGSNAYITPNHELGGRSVSVNIDARGAGPDETARLLSMRNDIIHEMRYHTENRLQRGVWSTNR